MNPPILSFRSNVAPYSVLSLIDFKKTVGLDLYPVPAGEDSDTYYFRVYNNWDLNSNIANAFNVWITTFDGAGILEHTWITPPVSQQWLHVFENAYGEGSVTPGSVSSFVGSDTAVGGQINYYMPEKGSEGVLNDSVIRAGDDNSGCGFIEFSSYLSIPSNAEKGSYHSFSISILYEYTP